jgi:hypothetical protein
MRGFSLGNLRERDQLVDLAVNGAITLKWILEKQAEKPWTELEFLEVVDYLRNCHLSQPGLCFSEVAPQWYARNPFFWDMTQPYCEQLTH